MKRILLCLVLVLIAGPALAHSRLLNSTPAANARVKPPAKLILNFSEVLEPAFSGAILLDKDGHAWPAPAHVEGASITLMPKSLAPGVWRVQWHVVGHDTHRLNGEFSFTVTP